MKKCFLTNKERYDWLKMNYDLTDKCNFKLNFVNLIKVVS